MYDKERLTNELNALETAKQLASQQLQQISGAIALIQNMIKALDEEKQSANPDDEVSNADIAIEA